jgi:hypothetical protein
MRRRPRTKEEHREAKIKRATEECGILWLLGWYAKEQAWNRAVAELKELNSGKQPR